MLFCFPENVVQGTKEQARKLMMKLDTIIVFLLLFLTSSASVTKDFIPSSVTILMWLLTLVLVFSKMHTKSFSYKGILVFALISLFMVVSSLVNHSVVLNVIKTIFGIFVVFYYVSLTDFKIFKAAYSKVLLSLTVISLVFYVLYLTIPSLSSIFVSSSGNYSYSNLILYSHCLGSTRNGGMFWEPGAFMVFISLAIIFEISSEKPNLLKIIVFSVAMISTFSTSGYLTLALCILVYLFKRGGDKHENKKRGLFIILLAVVFSLVFFFNYDLVFGKGETSTFGKIFKFFADREYENPTHGTSASIRYFSIVLPFKAFFEQPLFGIGREQLIAYTAFYTHSAITSTISNWFAIYGLFFGLIMTYGYYCFVKNGVLLQKGKILLAILFVILLISEDFSNNPLFYLFVFYGYYSTIKQRKLKEQNVCRSKFYAQL